MARAAQCAWLVVAVVVAAVSAGAQQRLSDVAGAIKLEKAGDGEVIDDQAVRRGGRPSALPGDLYHDRLASCVEQGRAFRGVLREAVSEDLFLDHGWRERLEEAAVQLEVALRSLLISQPPDDLAELWSTASEGAAGLQQALATTRAALEEDSPQLYSEALRGIDPHLQTIEAAMAGMRRIGRQQGAAAPPGEFDLVVADAVIAARCASYGEPGSSGHDSCVAQQRSALSAIQNRFTFTYNLDEPTFNRIRNECAQEFPGDLSARDACERRRMDAAGRAAAPTP